jgi:hypothetical protein
MRKIILVLIPLLFSILVIQANAEQLLGSGTAIKINKTQTSGIIYLMGKNWQTHLTYDNLKLSGTITTGKETATLSLIGMQIKDINYIFSGTLVENHRSTSVKINLFLINDNPTTSVKPNLNTLTMPVNTPAIQTAKKLPQILLLMTSSSPVTWGYNYQFQAKTYDISQNKNSNWSQNGGEIQGVRIQGKMTDKVGRLIHQFDGTTNQFGIYSDTYYMKDSITPNANYFVSFNATKDGWSGSSKSFEFTVFPQTSK